MRGVFVSSMVDVKRFCIDVLEEVGVLVILSFGFGIGCICVLFCICVYRSEKGELVVSLLMPGPSRLARIRSKILSLV